MARYLVEILGSNAATPWCVVKTKEQSIGLAPDEDGIVCTQVPCPECPDEDMTGPVALFTTREDANLVGLACRWNNQQYWIRVARGRVRNSGVVLDAITFHDSCQRYYPS